MRRPAKGAASFCPRYELQHSFCRYDCRAHRLSDPAHIPRNKHRRDPLVPSILRRQTSLASVFMQTCLGLGLPDKSWDAVYRSEQACNRSRRIYAPTLCLFYPDGDVCGIGFAKGMEVINLLRDAKRADCARAKKQTALRLSANRCRYRITPTASACRPLRSANNCRRPSGRPVRLPHSS